MSDNSFSIQPLDSAESLFLLLEQEKDRQGGNAGLNILSVYKSQTDCETVIKEHENKGQSKWGFKIPENHEFVIQEVPRELTFGLQMPSWKEEMDNLHNALEEIMGDMGKVESTESESESAKILDKSKSIF
tara:strand:- start:1471 stop:1863 length:393 start_codon:yes stop_codon:yes gene_type:complete